MTKITAKAVQASMQAASTSFSNARTDIQTALVNIVQHAHEHGDKSVVINDAPKWIAELGGANGAALVDYLVRFCAVKIKGKGFVSDHDRAVDLKGAKATLWHTLKPINAFKGFDLGAELARLITKAENATAKGVAEGKSELVHIPDADLRKLTEMAARLTNTPANDTSKNKDVLAA